MNFSFSPTAFRLGVPISERRLYGIKLPNFGRVHGGSMNYIGRTSSLHFLIGNELHRNGEVHGGSMNHIDPTSSLHFLIRNKLHRNGEVHRGSMNHFFIFVYFIIMFLLTIFLFSKIVFKLLFPNSLQAWGSNLLTRGALHCVHTFLAKCTEVV